MFCSALGPVPSPFDCFLANRGLKTLHLRMRQHETSALAVARYLEKNPRVERVIYPGMLGTFSNRSLLFQTAACDTYATEIHAQGTFS